MKGNLEKVLRTWVFDDEGAEFEVRATEPGGAVNLGVSFETLQTYYKLTGKGEPTFANLEALTPDTAAEIYDLLYWKKMRGDDLRAGVDYTVFDPVMNSGVTGGINILLAALELIPTGIINDDVVKRANSLSPALVIDNVCDARIIHMRLREGWPKYQSGWTKRVERVRTRAKSMLPTGGM